MIYGGIGDLNIDNYFPDMEKNGKGAKTDMARAAKTSLPNPLLVFTPLSINLFSPPS